MNYRLKYQYFKGGFSLFKEIKAKKVLMCIVGSIILAFGLYNVHSFADITEGGILGLTLLIEHWFHISPSISGFILNSICYLMGFKILGASFIIYSFFSGASFSLAYAFFEQFPPLWPEIVNHPFIASIVGALFVGIGVGIGVRAGGASGGDDALSMTISSITPFSIETIYLVSDLTVLVLSLCYIPFSRIFYSLFTCILSGQIIGIVSTFHKPEEETEEDNKN